MISILTKTIHQLGYTKLALLSRRTFSMNVTCVLATVAWKFFVSDSNVKSHLVFGQLSSLTFNLIFYNEHIGGRLDRSSDSLMMKEVSFVIHYVALLVLPIVVGKWVVNRCFGNITWIQSIKRVLYLGGVSMATLCVNEICKKKPGS